MATTDKARQGLCAPWCLIESEPANFAAMANMYGVKGVEFKDIYSIDILYHSPVPVYGLILSYDISSGVSTADNETTDPDAESIFFSCQVVTNVCATSALLGVLLNIDDEDLVVGEELKQFKKFTKDFSPVDRGMAIANSDLLKRVHNTFASFGSKRDAAQYPQYEDIKPNKRQKQTHYDEPDYHFVAFIPANGYIWELDGYSKAPIKLCSITGNWVDQMVPYFKERMSKTGAIDVSLISITKSCETTTSTPKQSPTPSSSTRHNHMSPTHQQPLDKATRIENEINFYDQLIKKVEGYLDARHYNWTQTSLESQNEMPDSTIYCESFVTGQSISAHFDLIDATTRQADLASQIRLRDHAIVMKEKLIKNRKECPERPMEDIIETATAEETIVIEPKNLIRRQHNYEILITSIFTKLQEENLLVNL